MNNIILAPRRITGEERKGGGSGLLCHALPRCHTLSINKRGMGRGICLQPDGGRERERGVHLAAAPYPRDNEPDLTAERAGRNVFRDTRGRRGGGGDEK